jgi:hypothetical protein
MDQLLGQFLSNRNATTPPSRGPSVTKEILSSLKIEPPFSPFQL